MFNIRQIIPEGYCSKCTGCCRFASDRSEWSVSLTCDEQQSLAIQDTKVQTIKDPSGLYICPFLKPDRNSCSIYYKRPLECQLYPFVINRKENKVFLGLDLHCDFARAQYQTQAMRDHIVLLASLCNSAEFLRVLRENPWLIAQYPGVLNLSEINL